MQPAGSKIMPSFTPSRASHASSSLAMKAFFSLSESAGPGLPLASLGATEFKATVTVRVARFEWPVRIAGEPTTIPSKYSG